MFKKLWDLFLTSMAKLKDFNFWDFFNYHLNLFVSNWPLIRVAIYKRTRKFLKRRWRKFQRVFEKPKKFFKWLFIVVVGIKTKATPKNILRFMRWCVIRVGSFYRTTWLILLTEDWMHKDLKFYLVINLIIILFFKYLQERRWNTECPVATLLYGKFVKKEKTKKQELEELRKKPKVKKIYDDPFHNRQERAKRIADKERRIAEKTKLHSPKHKDKKRKMRIGKAKTPYHPRVFRFYKKHDKIINKIKRIWKNYKPSNIC